MNRLERRVEKARDRHQHAFRSLRPRPVPLRVVASLLAVAMGLLGCPPAGHQGQAHPGRVEFQEPARIRVAQGFVNAIGGNLSIERTDISSDTHLGPFDLGAVYNSTTGRWLWSFEMSLVGSVFVDESGAEHAVGGVKDGHPVFGTRWLRHGPGAMRTKAGLVYVFDAGGRLHWIQMSRAPYPRLTFGGEVIAGRKRTTRISQCLAEPIPCQRLYDVAYDTDGRIVALEDPRTGRAAHFTWEGDRLVNARSPMEVAEGRPGRTYTYDLLGRISSLTTGDGERVEYGWDGVRVHEVRRVGAGDPDGRLLLRGRDRGSLHHPALGSAGGGARLRVRRAGPPPARHQHDERPHDGLGLGCDAQPTREPHAAHRRDHGLRVAARRSRREGRAFRQRRPIHLRPGRPLVRRLDPGRLAAGAPVPPRVAAGRGLPGSRRVEPLRRSGPAGLHQQRGG